MTPVVVRRDLPWFTAGKEFREMVASKRRRVPARRLVERHRGRRAERHDLQVPRDLAPRLVHQVEPDALADPQERRPEPSTDTASIATSVRSSISRLPTRSSPSKSLIVPCGIEPSELRAQACAEIHLETDLRVRPRRPSASSVRISSGRSTSNDSSRRSTMETGRPRASASSTCRRNESGPNWRGSPRRGVAGAGWPRSVRRARRGRPAPSVRRLREGCRR